MLLKIKKKKLIYSIIVSLLLLIVFILVKERVYALGTDCYCKGCNGYCKTCQDLSFCKAGCDCFSLGGGNYYVCCEKYDSGYTVTCHNNVPACTPQSCPSGTSESGTHGTYATYTCTNSCGESRSRTCKCTSVCTPQSCPSGTSESGTHGTYATYTCSNSCGESHSRTCKCTSACTAPSCPSGTLGTNTGDYYDTLYCTNSCSESQSRTCYCSICNPPSCSTKGYFDSMQYDDWGNSQGQVPNNLTSSCRNGYNAPNYISKCDMTYRTCYCSSCFKQCPTPLTNTNTANPNLILNNFKECTNDCSVKPPENQDDCYETESPQPTEELSIIKDPLGFANYYGFSSITHTGDRPVEIDRLGTLNDPFNPPITMKATYTDTNGENDIEGMFVWFREEQYSGELGTPLYISETAVPRASTNDSWGFMLRRSGNDWNPYVPSYQSESVFWTRALLNSTDKYKAFWIAGPNGQNMVEVTIIESPEEDSIEKKVSMEFSLRFSDNNGNLFPDNVSEGLYKIYLMGLDKFSFTPYDNYDIDYGNFWSKGFLYDDPSKQEDFSPFWRPNQLRYKAEQGQIYARAWSYTEKTWAIDRTSPILDTNTSVSGNSITLSWNASDEINGERDGNLNTIVGYVFSSVQDARNIRITGSSSSSGLLTLHPSPFKPDSSNGSSDKIGVFKDGSGYLFRVTNINSNANSGDITININDEANGSLLFYLTAFDDAGNIFQSGEVKQDLNDWMATSGGLAYSTGGTSVTAKDLTEVIWSGTLPPSNYGSNPGLIPPDVNFTSEMWGQVDRLINFIPSSPLHSYSQIFEGIKLEEGYYTLLMDLYEKNKKNLGNNVKEMMDIMAFSNAVSNYCSDREYCVFRYNNSSSNVIINQDFACNKKTLMFINGNLTINPPLKNSTGTDTLNSKNGCVFVVGGNVNILDGSDASNNTSFKYDNVNGYILADGQIIIGDETNKRVPNTDPIIDGIYVNGGLQSLGSNKSIVFNRYLRLEDRLKFPLLVIDLHPKYGVLGEKFFGSKYIIQTIELGVKP